jgi:hypothetical protein
VSGVSQLTRGAVSTRKGVARFTRGWIDAPVGPAPVVNITFATPLIVSVNTNALSALVSGERLVTASVAGTEAPQFFIDIKLS